MEEITDPEEETKRAHRRIWWTITGLLVLTVAILGYMMFVYDVAPPDDAWLLPKPFPPASGPHSIPELIQQVDKLLEAEMGERQKLPEDVRHVNDAEVPRAHAYVDKYHAILEALDQFLQVNQGPLPCPGGSEDFGPMMSTHYLTDFQEMANLAGMRARVLAHEGKSKEAIRQSLVLMRLGKQFSGEGSFLIHWLVGVTIHSIGINNLQNAALHHPWDIEDLEVVEKGLRDSEIPLRNFKFALQGDYLYSKRAVEQMVSSIRAAPFDFSHPGEWMKYTLKPHMTCVQMLAQMKLLYEACDKDGHACLLAGRENDRANEEFKQHQFRALLSVNISGSQLISEGVQYGGLCEKIVRITAYHRQLLTMVAMRRYELEQGTLPGKLDQLCPKHLATVPIDPYDNQPMRWNPAIKAVYSVGKDLKDDGGSFSKPGESTSHDMDVGMTYWWASLPK